MVFGLTGVLPSKINAIRLGTGMVGTILRVSEVSVTKGANECTEGTKPLRTDVTDAQHFGASKGPGDELERHVSVLDVLITPLDA